MTVHWSLALALFSIEQWAVEWFWGRPCSVHQAHHNSFVLGEVSRLLGTLGEWLTLSGMLMLNVEAWGRLRELRVASRYSLSPPGLPLWAFGMGLRIFWVWAVWGRLGGVDIEDAVLSMAWAVLGFDLYLSRSRRELLSRRAMWDFCCIQEAKSWKVGIWALRVASVCTWVNHSRRSTLSSRPTTASTVVWSCRDAIGLWWCNARADWHCSVKIRRADASSALTSGPWVSFFEKWLDLADGIIVSLVQSLPDFL